MKNTVNLMKKRRLCRLQQVSFVFKIPRQYFIARFLYNRPKFTTNLSDFIPEESPLQIADLASQEIFHMEEGRIITLASCTFTL